VRIIAACILGLTLAVAGPAQAQQNAATGDSDAFRRCILQTLRETDEQIDKSKVINNVLMCVKVPDDVLMGPRPQLDAWMAQAKREVAAQIEKLAPRAKAEKADEVQVGANYFLCLEGHAKLLALASDEAADLVAQASLSACPAERAAIFEVQRRYGDDWDEEAMKAMDNELAKKLLLEIVEIRAERNVSPAPPPEPKPPRTPI